MSTCHGESTLVDRGARTGGLSPSRWLRKQTSRPRGPPISKRGLIRTGCSQFTRPETSICGPTTPPPPLAGPNLRSMGAASLIARSLGFPRHGSLSSRRWTSAHINTTLRQRLTRRPIDNSFRIFLPRDIRSGRNDRTPRAHPNLRCPAAWIGFGSGSLFFSRGKKKLSTLHVVPAASRD